MDTAKKPVCVRVHQHIVKHCGTEGLPPSDAKHAQRCHSCRRALRTEIWTVENMALIEFRRTSSVRAVTSEQELHPRNSKDINRFFTKELAQSLLRLAYLGRVKSPDIKMKQVIRQILDTLQILIPPSCVSSISQLPSLIVQHAKTTT